MIITKEKQPIDFTLEKYLETKNLIKRLEEEADALKKEIVSCLDGKEELSTDFHKVTNKEQIRDGVDLKKLKELFPQAYSDCFKPSIYPVLRVK